MGLGEPALVIDLDGTLSRTDTLVEAFLRLLAAKPWAVFSMLWALRGGRAALKKYVARAVRLDPASLVYNEAVLKIAAEARAAGRRVLLVTAADSAIAEAVAAHVGVFEGVQASDGQTNLKGSAKAAWLVAKFGAGGFDYMGDAVADIPVWQAARTALAVAPGEKLVARAAQAGVRLVPVGTALGKGGQIRLLVRALRVHQWAKNVLIFVPALAAHHASPRVLAQAGLAFGAFSLCASSVYVLNDLLDLPHDRLHHSKRDRPFASGALDMALGPALMGGALLAGFCLALLLPRAFLLMLVGYYVCTLSYSFVLKRWMVWDVMMLAGLYTIRVFAGSAATRIPISFWLLAFAMFLFLSLAIVKRQTELVAAVRKGQDGKMSGRGYSAGDLDVLGSMATSSGYMSVMVMALYVNSPDVLALYPHPRALWALCPILLFWVSRVLMLSHRGEMQDDPVIFALKDRASLLTGLVALAVILVGAA